MKKQYKKTQNSEQNIVAPINGSGITNVDEYIKQKVKEFNEEYADVMEELAK